MRLPPTHSGSLDAQIGCAEMAAEEGDHADAAREAHALLMRDDLSDAQRLQFINLQASATLKSNGALHTSIDQPHSFQSSRLETFQLGV